MEGIWEPVSGGSLPEGDEPGSRTMCGEIMDGHIIEGVRDTKVGHHP